MAILGIDVGGTFTDAVLLAGGELRTAKVPTARAQEHSVVEAALEVGAGEAGLERFTHGTTIATNALLEGKGARTAFVGTAGFEHLLHLRRQTRAHLYRLCEHLLEPLVPLERCVGVHERVGPAGVLEQLDLDSLPDLDAEAVAICLLFSFRDPTHERLVAEEVRRRLPDAHVVASHEVAPEFREYERASTTTVDAYLGPVLAAYLSSLADRCREAGLPEPLVMRSSGGVCTLAEAARHPSFALVSGPAAGVVGAARVAALAGVENAISLDMGGTSTDVCLIAGGRVGQAAERELGGFPIRLPTVDLQTVGAGGGSIAWRDAGGALRVGPQSAGADPGPACYGRGGLEPTVTDANLALGRLPRRWPEASSSTRRRPSSPSAASIRRPSSTSSTRRCCGRSDSSRWSGGTTRGTSRSSRSGGPGLCTLASSPTRSASGRCLSLRPLAFSPRSVWSPARSGATACART